MPAGPVPQDALDQCDAAELRADTAERRGKGAPLAVGPVPPSAPCRSACRCVRLCRAHRRSREAPRPRRGARADELPLRSHRRARAAAAGSVTIARPKRGSVGPCLATAAARKPTEACASPALLLGRASDCGPWGSRAPALCTAVTPPVGVCVQDGRRLAEEELAAKARQVVYSTLRVACCTLRVAHRVARCMLRCVLHVALHVAHLYLCALHAARSLLWCASRHCPRRRSTARLCTRVAGSATAVVSAAFFVHAAEPPVARERTRV
jgi:hypothetical protein